MSERRTTFYHLEIYELHQPYRDQESLENTTRLQLFESSTPLGNFQIGHTIADGRALRHLGQIQHVDHMIGEYGDDEILHITRLYLYDCER